MDTVTEVTRIYPVDLRVVLGAVLRAKPRAWRLLNANAGTVRCVLVVDAGGFRSGQQVAVDLVAATSGTLVRVRAEEGESNDLVVVGLTRFLDEVNRVLHDQADTLHGG